MLSSCAFDLDLDFDLDFDLDREGPGFQPCRKARVLKGCGFRPRRNAPIEINPASAAEGARFLVEDVIPGLHDATQKLMRDEGMSREERLGKVRACRRCAT